MCFIICLWYLQKYVDELIFEILRLYRDSLILYFSCVFTSLMRFVFLQNFDVIEFFFFSISLILTEMKLRNNFVWWSFYLFFQNLTKWFFSFFRWLWFFCALIVSCFSMNSLKTFNHVFFEFVEMNFDFLCLFLFFLEYLMNSFFNLFYFFVMFWILTYNLFKWIFINNIWVFVFNFVIKIVLWTSHIRFKQLFCIIVKGLIVFCELSFVTLNLCHIVES